MQERADTFVRRISEYMHAHRMLPGGRFLVGVSGGADSVCLLLVLKQLEAAGECEIRAVHVHHGLRDSADRDQRFVQDLCARLQVQCEAVRVDAGDYAKKNGMGVEEAARVLRYRIFEEHRSSWEKETGENCAIAVAHHMEDQAETVLFHLCRGSNLAGAGGMRPVSGHIVRPLLQTRRREIETYLTQRKAAWCTDETNADPAYTRNLLRLQAMPILRKVNEKSEAHLCEFAQEAQEVDAFLSVLTQEALGRCEILKPWVEGGICLSVDALAAEQPVLRKRVLYQALARAAGQKKDITGQHIVRLMEFAEGAGYGEIALPCRVTACRDYGRLTLYRRETSQNGAQQNFDGFPAGMSRDVYPRDKKEYHCHIFEAGSSDGQIPTKKYTKWFDYDKISSLPVFRTRQPGDRITVTDSGISKKLSRYMIDEKISRSYRDRMVLPVSGQEVLWIPGYRMNAAYKVTQSTKRILAITWLPGESILQ